MSALPVQDIFDALHDAGLSVSLADGGGLVVSPGSRITPHLRELAAAYHAHHFKCPTCIAAGLGYGLRCGAGAALHTAYEDAASDRGGHE